MKKFLSVLRKIFAVIGGFIILVLAIVFLWTSWVKDAADNVLDQIHQWQMEAVFDASVLPSIMWFEEFSANMWVWTPMNIANAELQWWDGRGFENDEKYIYGTFVFENGQEEILTFWFQEVEDIYVLLGITGWAPESSEF